MIIEIEKKKKSPVRLADEPRGVALLLRDGREGTPPPPLPATGGVESPPRAESPERPTKPSPFA